MSDQMRLAIIFQLLIFSSGSGWNFSFVVADDDGFEKKVQPFFQQYCRDCHSQDNAEGEFSTDGLESNFNNLSSKARWSEVVNVLNSHEMPPEDQPQPSTERVSEVVDWITGQIVDAERTRQDSSIVLRRLNRDEYRNTIRDLVGIDVDVSGFPEDPPAGGFDNNGNALSLSPLLLELYYATAQKILDKAMVSGDQPVALKWRFQLESGDNDSNRVSYDGQRLIVNGGQNKVVDQYKVMHHNNWDRHLNVRDFALPNQGRYLLRIRAFGKVPKRQQVVDSAEVFLRQRLEQDNKERPKNEKYHRQAFEETLEHFRTDPMYDYGPPRIKLVQTLGGQPRVVAEFDVDATADQPQEYEVQVDFSSQKAGINLEYAYAIPRELENSWFQTSDDFARPELWVDWIELEGPIYGQWPPQSHQRLLLSDKTLGEQATEKAQRPTDKESRAQQRLEAQRIIKRFMQRAFRRPITEAELTAKMELYDAAAADGTSLIETIKYPLTAVLVSPHFLFLAEPLDQAGSGDAVALGEAKPRSLNQYQLATRLSYFLWSSMPDDRLFSLAAKGQLSSSVILSAEVDRMLVDPKASSFVANFAGQWLDLRDVGANPPAEDLYPRYDRHLEQSIVAESEAFFAEILHKDLSVMNFVASDFVVINERLGRYYGIANVRGDHFRSVPVPAGVQRGGVLTQASILSTTSNGTRTSPVKRGTWVMKNLLGMDPGLPVANAGDIAPKVPGIDKATVRNRLEIHRTLPQCARCHNKIDPLGFALENYNAAGAWRDQEGFGYKGRVNQDDPVVDASAKMIDGTEFVGVRGLQKVLSGQQVLFLKCLSGKMLTYALGRELDIADSRHVDQAAEHLSQGDQSMRSLIKWIVVSEVFQSK